MKNGERRRRQWTREGAIDQRRHHVEHRSKRIVADRRPQRVDESTAADAEHGAIPSGSSGSDRPRTEAVAPSVARRQLGLRRPEWRTSSTSEGAATRCESDASDPLAEAPSDREASPADAHSPI